MGRFTKLMEGKGKDVTIGDDKFNIKPLGGDAIGLLMGNAKEGNDNDNMMEMVLESLRQSDSDLTMADVKEIPLGMLLPVIETVVTVNELDKQKK